MKHLRLCHDSVVYSCALLHTANRGLITSSDLHLGRVSVPVERVARVADHQEQQIICNTVREVLPSQQATCSNCVACM